MPPVELVEELTNGGQMLFDGRLSERAAELLDVRRDRDRFDIVKLQPAFIAPVEEAFDGARIGGPRVAIADTGGEEFDEAAAGALALGAHDRRQRLEAGPDQRRRRDDLFA